MKCTFTQLRFAKIFRQTCSSSYEIIETKGGVSFVETQCILGKNWGKNILTVANVVNRNDASITSSVNKCIMIFYNNFGLREWKKILKCGSAFDQVRVK